MKPLSLILALVIGAVSGASFNELRTKDREAGRREALEITANRLIEDYVEFAHHRARIEAFISEVCRDQFYMRVRTRDMECPL